MKEILIGHYSSEELLKRLNENPELRDKFIRAVASHLVLVEYPLSDDHSQEIQMSGCFTNDNVTSGCDKDFYLLKYLLWRWEYEEDENDRESEEDEEEES